MMLLECSSRGMVFDPFSLELYLLRRWTLKEVKTKAGNATVDEDDISIDGVLEEHDFESGIGMQRTIDLIPLGVTKRSRRVHLSPVDQPCLTLIMALSITQAQQTTIEFPEQIHCRHFQGTLIYYFGYFAYIPSGWTSGQDLLVQ
jgi:hypothetical protein